MAAYLAENRSSAIMMARILAWSDMSIPYQCGRIGRRYRATSHSITTMPAAML
jgi:hypothetical protein